MRLFFTTLCAAVVLCGASLFPSRAVSPGTDPPVAAAWTATEAPTARLIEKGFPNFGKLNTAVWRSGQPKKEGYARLTELGVKTVVNLQEENPEEQKRLPAGVKYVYIPIVDQEAPTEAQARQFLDVVANPDNWPVLVHCHMGEGRAGVMCALMRHSFDGWDDKRIMREVDNFHVRHLGLLKINLDIDQRHFIEKWEADNAPGAYREKISH